MGVKNLPCMYVNGVLTFSSLIPAKDELERAIQAVL